MKENDEWDAAWDIAAQWAAEGGEDDAELAERLGLDDLAEQIRTGREELELHAPGVQGRAVRNLRGDGQ